jgi:hypothetical protein
VDKIVVASAKMSGYAFYPGLISCYRLLKKEP